MYVIPWIILMDLLYSEVIPEVGMPRTEVLGACADTRVCYPAISSVLHCNQHCKIEILKGME